jgi:hypothetical protein
MSQTNPKKGGNKGILAEKRERKRQEAERRNAKTPIERTRAYRRQMEGVANAQAEE